MRRQIGVGLIVLGSLLPVAPAYSDSGCGDLVTTDFGGAAAKARGQCRGLIALEGQPDVLQTAAHSGTAAGCGDCVWTLVMMCLANTPNDPHNQQPCVGAARSLKCRPGQTAFRLYLTT